MSEVYPEFEYCQNNGLHVLEHGPSSPDVDIVAVHGLAANPVYTWVKKVPEADIKGDGDRVGRLNEKGFREVMWLKHLLPTEIPNARILKYNYASAFLRDAPKETLRSIAERLVNLLHEIRVKEQSGTKRPLIFIGHSFGGVVIEEALVYAYAHKSQELKHITLSTCGIVFLGTPHRGSTASPWGVVLANSAAALGLGSHNGLLKTLKRDSEVLERLLNDFTVLAQELHMKLICFYETNETRIGLFLKAMVVDKRSASLDGYLPRSLASNHSMMNKFGFRTEENFIHVCSAIKELVEWSRQLRFAPSITVGDEIPGNGLYLQLPSPTGYFTGRNSHLKKMKQYFETETIPDGIQKRKVLVLHGLGGSGKTQLALKFVELHSNWFWKIFFMDASNAKVLNLQLGNIAKTFKAGETAEQALTWLFTQQRNWLLIFDNADDPSLDLKQYFPNGTQGSIIITTRNQGCTVYAPQSNIYMTDFSDSPQDAVDLLLKASMLELPCDGRTLQSASSLARKLGYLPLAISQAGAYIRQNSTVEEYLELFNKRRKDLLGKSIRKYNIHNPNSDDPPVYVAWDISWGHLNDSAKDFLKLCAFLHNEGIPKSLFQNGIPRLLDSDTNEQAQLNTWKSLLQSHWTSHGEWDVLKFNSTITQLTSYSFVTVSENASLYSLHELVHFWVRDSLDTESSMALRIITTKLICSQLSTGHVSFLSNYKCRRQLLPHAAVCTISDTQDLNPKELLLIAHMYRENGQWEKAEKLESKVMPIMKNTLGAEHPDTLACMNSLALTYSKQGRWEKAEELYKELLQSRETKLGKKHADTLSSMDGLARTYNQQGRLVEAEKLGSEVLETSKRILGRSNPVTLAAMSGLASTYTHQGRLTEAEKLETELLKARKRIFGADHPSTLATMNNLAATYSKQTRWAEAEKLYLEALEVRKRESGLAHPDTLAIITNLAATYSHQKRWAEAEKLHLEVLEACNTVLGREHPSTLSTMNNLAATYSQQRRWAEAEKLHLEVLEVRKRKLGTEHPKTLLSMDSLAMLYKKQGRLAEARQLLTQVVEGRKKKLGEGHRYTVDAVRALQTIPRSLV